jgi:signal transduction histidine kinase
MNEYSDKIIIVDDIPDNLEILNTILTEEGYNVRVFQKASMALDAAIQSPPGLFLLDIIMPDMNGYELCMKLQENENTRGIPVIFLSALNEINEKIKAFKTGGVDFISKPYQSAEILVRVQTHLKLRSLQLNLETIVEERTQELEKRNKELLEANKAKSNFLANINHELRTPLNGVSGMLSVLESMDISDSERYFLDMAVTSADHLSSIMQDILSYSEIDSGRLGIFNQAVQIEQLIQNTVNLLTPRSREKNIDIIFEGKDNSDVFFGDSARITEILEKLLSNAIKFSDSGTIKIHFEVNQDLKLSISDHGIGIQADRLTEIFQPFQQLEDPYTKKYQGVGIGLAIIKKLLDLMEGEISVESELETGSVFTIIIPNNASAVKLEKSSNNVELSVNRSDSPNLNILIAEDESINRMYLKNILNKAGHHVLEVCNGEEALAKTLAENPDFIFMDIGMPVMNGIEATKCIRKTDGFSTIPIIALTAHTHKEDIEKFLNSGLNEVLKKPFKENEIHSIIKKYV